MINRSNTGFKSRATIAASILGILSGLAQINHRTYLAYSDIFSNVVEYLEVNGSTNKLQSLLNKISDEEVQRKIDLYSQSVFEEITDEEWSIFTNRNIKDHLNEQLSMSDFRKYQTNNEGVMAGYWELPEQVIIDNDLHNYEDDRITFSQKRNAMIDSIIIDAKKNV